MKTFASVLLAVLFTVIPGASAVAQNPTYDLVLENDTAVDSTTYEFDITLIRTGGTVFELASLQPIMTFDPAISSGTLSLSLVAGTSGLNASQVPTTMSVTGNELRINPRIPPGVGSGTIIPPATGLRVGRFRLTSTTAFAALNADIAWKNSGLATTKVFAYNDGDQNVEITDTARHLSSLQNPVLSQPVILSTSPRPAATAGTLYRDTLRASGGVAPLTWAVIAGALPSGITLSTAGIVNGTAALAGVYNFTAQVTDNSAATDQAAFSLTVNTGAAAALAFVQQPTDELAGVFISPAPTVRLRDASGNTVTTAGVAVTMSLTSGNGTLTGSLTETTNASGIATFDSLRIDRKGIKVVTASSAGLTAATSAAFEVLQASASQIRVETAPDGSGTIVPAQSVLPLSPLTVYAISRDDFDNFIENIAANAWALQGATGGVTGGDLVPAGDNRSAVFTGHLAGSAQIRATSPGLTAVNSGTITVVPGVSKKLAFIQQPSNGIAGAVVSPAVTVQLRDTTNNPVAQVNVPVTLTLSSGTGTLGGTLTKLTNGSGLATFDNLTVNAAGVKALTASSTGLTSAVSGNFTLSTYTITATAGANGSITPTGAVPMIHGADTTFTITANPLFHIAGVTVDGAPVGAVSSVPFTNVTANHTVAATFAADTVQVTVQTTPAGRSIIVDGVTVTAPQDFNWVSGSLHSISTDSLQNGAAGTRYRYQSWSDAGPRTHTVSPTANTVYTAAFGTQHLLTMTAGTGGTVSPVSDWKDAGSAVGISATPNAGYSFTSWTGTGTGSYTGTNPTPSVTMTGPITETANFGTNPISVTVTTAPAGLQMVVDGVTYVSPQVFDWTATQPHTISVDSIVAGAAGTRHPFQSWSDAGARTHVITPLTDGTFTATMSTQHLLTVNAGTGGTAGPPNAYYTAGQSVQITATAGTGYTFSGWVGTGTGSYTGPANPTNVTMNSPVTQTASFTANPIVYTVTTTPPGLGIVVDGTPYTSPQAFNWTAAQPHTISVDSIQDGAAGTRHLYTSWSNAGTRTQTITPLATGTVTANFRAQYFLTMTANAGGTVLPASNWIDSAQTVQITGFPSAGYGFAGWAGTGTGSYTGNENPRNITVRGPIEQTANFTLLPVQVTIRTFPTGRTFRVDGSGPLTNTFTFTFNAGETHTISADSIQNGATGTRYVWTSWSDGGTRAHTLLYPGKDTTIVVNFKTQFQLTMNAATGGTTSPPSGFFDSAQIVGISATPAPTFAFGSWTGGGPGSYTGPNNPASVTMNGPVTETPAFILAPIDVTIQTVPAGRGFLVDGNPFVGTQNFTWSATQSHTISTITPQGDTLTRYSYASWSDGGLMTHSVSPTTDTIFTLNFTTQYRLATAAGTGGTVTPPTGFYNAGQAVQVSATPIVGYNFGGWTGTGSGSYTGTNNPATVTMNAPITEEAAFNAGTIPITVTTTPAGRTIIVDGTTYTSPQTFNWTTGSSHTIATDSIQSSLTPGVRSRWLSWSDAGAISHTVAPVAPTTYTAAFKTQYQLTMVANPGGTVTPSTGFHDSLASVVITGIPNSGYIFSGWVGTGTGQYSGTINPQTITVGGPISETANFVQPTVNVTIQSNPPGRTFIVDGVTRSNTFTFSFSPGTTHTLNTDSIQNGTTGTRYLWTSWSDGGAKSHTIIYPGKDTTFVVNFKTQFQLTMNAAAGGTATPPTGFFDSAQVVPITATPSGGYTFAGWVGSGVGSYTGPLNPATVSVNGPITESAAFTLAPINVRVMTNPRGLQFLVDGTAYVDSQAFIWSATSTHNLSATSPQGDTATRFLFAAWSDGGTQTHSVSPSTDSTFTVNFSTQHYLAMDTGTGGGTLSPASGFFNAGQVVQVSATPRTGYEFAGWTGTGSGSYTGPNNPATVTMNAPITETSSWSAGTIPVTVTTAPAGLAITVDGVSYTSPQTFNWATGSSHTIATDSLQTAAAPGTRYRWASWSDAGALTHTVAPGSPATFTATFATQYLLTMTANPGGTVTPPSGWHDAASTVTITGLPNAGFSFSSWIGSGTGSYTGTVNPRSITVSGPVTQIANFVQNPFQVVVGTSPAGRTFRVNGVNYTTQQTFSVTPGSSLSLSIPDTVQAIGPSSRLAWRSWSDGGAVSHLFAPTSDTTITAAFATQFFLTMSAGAGGSVSPPSGWQDSASAVQVTATPSGGYTFAGWVGTGVGSYSGPLNPATVNVNGPITESGSFTLFPVTVRLRSNPPGRTVLVDTIPYVTPQDIIWTSGTAHTISADSVQGGETGVRYLYAGWSDGKSRTHAVTGLGDTTFTVTFRSQYFLSMDAGPGGTVTPPDGWYDSAAVVPITATPGTGYVFSDWTGAGAGSYTGTLNPAAATMHGPVGETANFALDTVTVTVRTTPDGYPVYVDGVQYTSPAAFRWLAGSEHSVSTDSAQAPSGGARLGWISWNDAGARTHTVAPMKDTTFTATLGLQYFLTMVANPGGTVSPPSGWVNNGATVTITATPNLGYAFASWSGGGTGSYSGLVNPRNITVGGPITQTANFNQNSILVTVQTNPPGRTFRVDGTSYTTVNTFSFLPGTTHTFTADSLQPGTLGRRYAWTGWSTGAPRTHTFIAPTKDSTVTVSFGLQWELLTTASPLAGGTINPPGQTYYNAGDTVSVLATSNRGYAFTAWSGSVTSSANPVSVVMDSARSLTATFQAAATVILNSDPPGRTLIVDGFAFVAPDTFSWLLNSTHNLGSATPQSGNTGTRYQFHGWSDSGAMSHAVTVNRDTSFTASFQTEYYLLVSTDTNGTVLPGEGWHIAGDSVTLLATPKAGYGFIEWKGTGPAAYSGFSNPVTLTMSDWATQVASFGQILPPPTLTGIANHAVDQPITPRLSWNAYAGADKYIVQVSLDSLFGPLSNIVDSAGITDTTILLPVLRNVETYFWRVKAMVGPDITAFSERRDFTTIGATIAVTSPALNWGTGFTYDITWASQNLSGPVDILLSTDGGTNWTIVDSNLAGSSTRYRVAPTQTVSNFCLVRVVSSDNGQFFGNSRNFSILAGALPLIVPVSTTIPYPAEPTISTFYRLVSHPGVVDTTVPLDALIPGANPKDWRMFSDNGRPENYLTELGASSKLETGRGYWLLKRNDFFISANMVMPPLDTINAVYRIRLRSGWNIVANPFDRTASWSSILALNGLPSTTALYGYEGSYQPATLLAPFRGYYFYNGTNLSELKIAYPFGTAVPSIATRDVEWEMRLEYSSEINDDPANFIGVSKAAADGIDDLESHKPPVFLDQGFLYFNRPEWDAEFSLFNTDYRPAVGEGQTWEFEVSREYGTTGTLRFDGIDHVPAEYDVVLVNEFNSAPVDLRKNPEYSFASVSTTMPFRILVGPKEYVERQAAKEVPAEFGLSQNFPNPFNSTTSISVKLPRESRIRLDVYDVLGRKVATLAEGEYPAGTHTFLWEGIDDRGLPVSSGIYLYRLVEGDRLLQAKKMIIAK